MGEVCGYNISMKIKAIFKEGLYEKSIVNN